MQSFIVVLMISLVLAFSCKVADLSLSEHNAFIVKCALVVVYTVLGLVMLRSKPNAANDDTPTIGSKQSEP